MDGDAMDSNIYQLVENELAVPCDSIPEGIINQDLPQEEAIESVPLDGPSNPAKRKASPASRKGKRRAEFVDTEENWTAQVKEKQQRSKRTGQACDRCKIRRLRCDPAPDGCFHCITSQKRCMVTDRTTGHTLERGEGIRLKAENASLHEKISALQAENGRLRNRVAEMQTQLNCVLDNPGPLRSVVDASSACVESEPPASVNGGSCPFDSSDIIHWNQFAGPVNSH